MRSSVRITINSTSASGKRKSWFKHVTRVDLSKTNGYAFEGDFLGEAETDLPVGAIVIEKVPGGSVRYPTNEGRIWRVGEDGLEEVGEGYDWAREFLSFRDQVAEELNQVPSMLEHFTSEELVEELERRGKAISR